MADLFDQALADIERAPPLLPTGPLRDPPPEKFTRRGLTLRPAPADTDDDWIDLDELETVLMDATARYLRDPDPGHVLLLAAPAGGGKTRLGVRLAERVAAGGHRVLYAGPRRDFFADTQALAQRPAWWYQWLPRQGGDSETGEPMTCRWPEQMAAWLERGYPAMDFCANPRVCGWSYIRERCAYHRQKETATDIVFGQHAHVALGHPLMDRFGLVIGDELPLGAFLHPWRIPSPSIVPPDMDDEDLIALLRNLRFLCANPPDGATGWEGAGLYRALPGGPAAVIATLEAAHIPASASVLSPQVRNAGQADEAPYAHLLQLAPLMLREARRVAQGLDVIPRVRCAPDGLTLRLRHAPANLPRHVVWLDATGDGAIYQTLLGRPVEVVRPKVRLTGRVYQVWASANNRGAVLDDRPDAAGETKGRAKQAALQAQIARIVATRGYQSPATITYKPIGDSLLPGAPHTHFGGNRGTNRLEGCDALFVVGAPLPTLAAIQDTAAMVFFERDEPFRRDWHAIDVPFTGQAAAHSVGGFWDDPDLTTLLQQLREAEIAQAAHRARPLRRDVDVWLLTNVVVPGLPVELVSLAALFGAVDAAGRELVGIDPYRWPAVLALPATADDPLTFGRMEAELNISGKTARRWYQALKDTGRYTEIDVAASSRRGPKPRGLVKTFDAPK